MSSTRLFRLAMLAAAAAMVQAVVTARVSRVPDEAHSAVNDWTTHSVVFSGVSDADSDYLAAENPRYRMQRGLHKSRGNGEQGGPKWANPSGVQTPSVPSVSVPNVNVAWEPPGQAKKSKDNPPSNPTFNRDWSTSLLAGGKVGAGMFPAKFTYDVNATPDCTNDFAVFNTSLVPSALTKASATGTFTSTKPGNGATVTIGTVTLTAGAQWDKNDAANTLRTYIHTNTATLGFDASGSGQLVNVTWNVAGSVGNSVALSTSMGTGVFSWNSPTLFGGADGSPSIVAYDALYSTQSATLQGYCPGAGPSVMFAYLTGSGSVVTSSVMSLDGTKIMYLDTSAAGAVLHILKWKVQGTLGVPVAPDTTATNWATSGTGSCAPANSCVINVTLNGNPQVTRSSPFYDYASDTLFVGDNAGRLHKFTPVLTSTPAEITTGGWPLTVNAGATLASPVLGFVSHRIYVGDSTGRISFINNPVSGTPVVGGFVNQGGAIVDAPLLDDSAHRLFVFNGSDSNKGTVYQYDNSLNLTTSVNVGFGGTARNIYTGAFNEAYWSTGTGSLLVCGNSAASVPTLYRITVAGGQLSGGLDSLQVGTSSTECSPVTQFYNSWSGTERIFFSVGSAANQTGCTGGFGCIMSLDITGTAWPGAMTATSPTPGNSTAASTSGIVIDNIGGSTTAPQTSLNGAITNSTSSITVSSTTGFAVNDYIQVDSEIMQITAVTNTTTLAVARGQRSTTAVSHLTATKVVDLRMTLTNGSTGTGSSITVQSTTTFDVNDYIQIENEAMQITGKGPTTLTVTRGQLGSSNVSHAGGLQVNDLTRYPQGASIYFSFLANSVTGALCNGTTGLGCAVKLTQSGLK